MINVNLNTFTDSNVKLNVASTSVEYARWGDLTGNIESQTDLINLLDEKADTTDIPTKTSDLVNDSGFITSAPVTSVNGQTGDVVIPNASSQNYGLAKVDVTMSDTSANPVQNQTVKWYVDNHIPTKTSQLTNDSNFVVDANYVHTANNFTDALLIKLNGIANGAEANVQSNWAETDGMSDSYILNKPVIPSKTSQLTNDSGFITSSSLPTKTSDLTNDSGFITDVPHATSSVYGTVKVDMNGDPPAGYIKLTYGNDRDIYTPLLLSTSDTIRSKFLPSATTSTKGAVIVDNAMSDSSTNPVQNSVVKDYIDNLNVGVSDVKVGTTSVVSGGVATIPVANTNDYGAVKVTPQYVVFQTANWVDLTFSDGTARLPMMNKTTDTIVPGLLPSATSSVKGAVIVDNTMSDSSTNPVQNSVIKSYIDSLVGDVESLLESI